MKRRDFLKMFAASAAGLFVPKKYFFFNLEPIEQCQSFDVTYDPSGIGLTAWIRIDGLYLRAIY